MQYINRFLCVNPFPLKSGVRMKRQKYAIAVIVENGQMATSYKIQNAKLGHFFNVYYLG